MNNTICVSRGLARFLLVSAAAICLSAMRGAYAQSLNLCEPYELHPGPLQPDYLPNNVLMNVCIAEWTSNGTPQVDAFVMVEVDSSSAAYIPYTDAEIILGGIDTSNNSTFLGQSDYNNGSDPPNGEGSEDSIAGVTAAMALNTVYVAYAGYGFASDPTGNYCYDPVDDQYDGCTWTDYWANPNYTLGTNFFDPSVQVLSVLYAPPGDQSTTGYTNGTTNGTTTSVGNSFTQSYGVEFDGEENIFGDFGGSIGYTNADTTGNTTAYQTTLTDMTGISGLANTLSTYNPNHLDLPDRRWDSFLTLLNSQITTASDDSGDNIGYSVGLVPVSSDGWTTDPATTEEVAEDMINGTVSTATLEPNPLPRLPGQPQYFLPGLASICKNLMTSEYTTGSCTSADQCGCQKSDFSTILGQDTLLGWNAGTLTASPMPAYESPVDADSSGAACLTPNSSLSCRYVPIPQSTTNPAPQPVQLSYGFANSFTQSDATSTSVTFQEQQSHTVTVSVFFGWNIGAWGTGVNAKIKNTDSWTWTNTETQGKINGVQNSMNVNLETNNSGCAETNYVYEDTVYHTFVVQPPNPIYVPNCLH